MTPPPPPHLPVYMWENSLPVLGIKLLDWIFNNRLILQLVFLPFQKHFALSKSESNQDETTKRMALKMAAINQNGLCHGNSNW